MSNTIANQTPPPAILFVDDEATAVKYFERAIGAIAPVVTGGSVEDGKAMLDAHGASLAVLNVAGSNAGFFNSQIVQAIQRQTP